jgi:hypothetical protein
VVALLEKIGRRPLLLCGRGTLERESKDQRRGEKVHRLVMLWGMVLLMAVMAGGAALAATFQEGFSSYATFQEDFSSYSAGWWEEGSIHGPWEVSYDSNPCGRVGIITLDSGQKVYRADLSGCDRLRATKTRTLVSYPTDVTVEWEFRVVSKTLATQKDWHTAWLGWAHTGDNSWNNLMLKQGSEGWEVGKFSPECPEGGSNRNQCYFETGRTPQFSDGEWHTARVEQRTVPGGVEITTYGDGQKLATVRDTTHQPNTVGNVLLYNEGSIVDFRRVEIYPGADAPGDQTAPNTQATLSAEPNASGWHTQDVTVTLTAQDNPGGTSVKEVTYWATDSSTGEEVIGRATVPYDASDLPEIVVSPEGQTTLRFFATDKAGNPEQEQTFAIKIDRTAPLVEQQGTIPDGWTKQDVSVPFTAGDALSDLADPTDASFVLSTSVPENMETANAQTETRQISDVAVLPATAGTVGPIKVDKKAPTTQAALSQQPNVNGWHNQDVTVTLTAGAENGSGVEEIVYILNGAAPVHEPTNPAQLSVGSAGVNELTYYAIDHAGNQESPAKTLSVKIDKSAPDTTIGSGPSGTVSSTSASFSFSSSETGSIFQCSRDGSTFSLCTSPKSYSSLSQGNHTFRVRAIDNGRQHRHHPGIPQLVRGHSPPKGHHSHQW